MTQYRRWERKWYVKGVAYIEHPPHISRCVTQITLLNWQVHLISLLTAVLKAQHSIVIAKQ